MYRIQFALILCCGLFGSCYDWGRQTRARYYKASLEPYKVIENLKTGDSITVYLGDSIPFRYERNKFGREKGRLLVLRNGYGNLEFYEVGAWTDDHSYANLYSEALFDRNLGCVSDTWRYISNPGKLFSTGERFVQNDSLIQVVVWYHPNGKPKEETIHLIKRGYDKRQADKEKSKRIGTWKFYSDAGKLKRRTVHSSFK